MHYFANRCGIRRPLLGLSADCRLFDKGKGFGKGRHDCHGNSRHPKDYLGGLWEFPRLSSAPGAGVSSPAGDSLCEGGAKRRPLGPTILRAAEGGAPICPGTPKGDSQVTRKMTRSQKDYRNTMRFPPRLTRVGGRGGAIRVSATFPLPGKYSFDSSSAIDCVQISEPSAAAEGGTPAEVTG